MSLFQKLAIIENKIAAVEGKLGLPQRRHLLVRKKITNHINKTEEIQDTLILPQPYIINVSPKFVNLQINVEGADSIGISINDLQVEIPRTYPKTLFLSETSTKSTFILEPPLNSSNQIIYSNPSTKVIAGASFYNLLFLSEDDPTIWKLILSKEIDSKK